MRKFFHAHIGQRNRCTTMFGMTITAVQCIAVHHCTVQRCNIIKFSLHIGVTIFTTIIDRICLPGCWMALGTIPGDFSMRTNTPQVVANFRI